MTFPPPNPNQQILPTDIESSGGNNGRSPRRTASIVALTTGLLVGGVLVGSQFVAADTPGVADDQPTSTNLPAAETAAASDDAAEPDPEAPSSDGLDWMDVGGLFDIDPEVAAEFEKFAECISDQASGLDLFDGFDVMGEDAIPPFDDFSFDHEDFNIPSGAFVEAGDDTGFYEFGDGDGTITITKSGDTISVSSDGDVNVQTFELPELGKDFLIPELSSEQQAELEDSWAELEDTLQAAEDACGDLLPGDAIGGLLEGVFSDGLFAFPND